MVSTIRELRKKLSELGIKKNTFDTWKKRGEISAEGILQLSQISGMPINEFKEGTAIAGIEEGQIHYPGGIAMRISALLVSAERILKSSTPFANALAYNIDTFAVGLDLWEKKEVHHPPQKLKEGKT